MLSKNQGLYDKPYRYRHIYLIIKLAVLLYIFLPSHDVRAILFHLFRVRVSCKTICAWGKKFIAFAQPSKITYAPSETVILYADEKYVWVKGVKHYWWSVRDHTGRLLAKIVTAQRDAASAKALLRRAKARINGEVHAVVRDGLASYDKPIRHVFGKNCLSFPYGIRGRSAIINGRYFWISNNMSESLNAQIDNYLAKHQYNFNTLESANFHADMFEYRWNLRLACS